MAIRYAGDKNLIGYGRAQVYKDKDLTQGAQIIAKRQERAKAAKAKAAAAKKKAADKALAALLKDNDLSKVRNADIDYLKNEFDAIIGDAGGVVRNGGNPGTDIDLQRRLNEYRANVSQSQIGKERYDDNLKEVTTNKDYQSNENINKLGNEVKAAMFGEGATYFDSEAQGEEGTEGYVAEVPGMQVGRLTPNLDPAGWEEEVVGNIKPQAISMTQDGKFKLPASGGNYLTFETKKEATDAQLELAATDLYNNHIYSDDMKMKYDQLAIDNNFYHLDDDDNQVPDTMAYLKDKVAGMVTEVDMTGVKEIKSKGTYVNVDYGDKQMAAAGEKFDTDVYTMPGVRTNEKGESVVVEDLEYQTVDIPAVYKDVPDPANPGKTKKELVTPERTGQTFNFGQNKEFDVRPGDAGFMIFGQSDKMGTSGLNPGFNKTGENIQFVPNSIVFKPTADAEMTVEVDGINQTFQKGEALDVAAVKALEKQKKEGYSSMPWLEGRDKNGMTVSVGFNESVHARFSTFVTYNSKQDREVYENVMRGIGVDPLKKRAKKR